MNKSRISNLKNLIAKRRSRFLQTEAKAVQSVSEAVGTEAQQAAETPMQVEPEVPVLEEDTPAQDIGIVSDAGETAVEASTGATAEPAVEMDVSPVGVIEDSVDVVEVPVESPVESAPTEDESLLVVEDGEAAVVPAAEEQPVVKRRRRKVKENA